ncbi:MAG: glycoside hydrolase family 127 protein, partial [Planctomycetota bacterium]|nr:glycoside hydrolase family 127 protein [Planctomycetota bacterium]
MGLRGFLLAALALPVAAQDPEVQPPLVPVPFEKVRFTPGFWKQRLAKNRETTVPLVLEQCEVTGRIANFDLAARGERKGHTGHSWDDADVYRSLEAVAHTLASKQDAALSGRADAIIERIAAAQDENGYLNTYVMVERPGARWDDIKDGYELFCAGHLIEAGIAYAQATGKRALLDVAIRLADHIDSTFGPEGRGDPPGHQEIELALAQLHAHTGEERYLRRAEYFLERRGERDERELWGPDYQDVLPVRRQFGVSGDAVRTMYQLCGMADVYAATRDYGWLAPLINCWRDVTEKRMYVTGAVGNSAKTKGFTEPFDLPNESAWCETCASIGMAMWQQRMLLQTR